MTSEHRKSYLYQCVTSNHHHICSFLSEIVAHYTLTVWSPVPDSPYIFNKNRSSML